MSIKQFKNLKKRIKKVWRLLPKRTFHHLTLSRSKGLKMKDLEFSKLFLEKFKIIMINTVNLKLINLSNCKNQTKNKIQLIKAKTIQETKTLKLRNSLWETCQRQRIQILENLRSKMISRIQICTNFCNKKKTVNN